MLLLHDSLSVAETSNLYRRLLAIRLSVHILYVSGLFGLLLGGIRLFGLGGLNVVLIVGIIVCLFDLLAGFGIDLLGKQF